MWPDGLVALTHAFRLVALLSFAHPRIVPLADPNLNLLTPNLLTPNLLALTSGSGPQPPNPNLRTPTSSP